MGHPYDWNQIADAPHGAPHAHFGDPRRELEAARSGAVICPLSHFELLRFSGVDAQSFLQGQLTCDVLQVTPTAARYGGYCTPKGRLIADFLLMRTPQAYLMHLPADSWAMLAERLRKFVLRTKVEIGRETTLRAIGIAGPEAVALLRQSVGEPPRLALESVQYASATLLRLPGAAFLAIAPQPDMAGLWDLLARQATPAGMDCWNWLQIHAGIPWISAATREQFVPQMVALDAIGGVDFQKGCYPGQEIVARTHYLGEVKRALRFGHGEGPATAGDVLLRADGLSVGMVVNAAPAPDGGTDLLAVVQTDTDGEQPRLRSADGPAVRISQPSGAR
ncbi:MAG TPA: folate-binding protein [Burkholderiales bacterium]|nr:folate-binding protein [Burkholderiales bacterium]